MINIIIPIHNAFDHVHTCIESVLKTTQYLDCTIVLIDDASTDPRVGTYLAEVQSKYPERTHLITLQKNVGFVQAVNFGFSQTRGQDIVLLNSDTVVYDGWLEQLSSIALNNPNTGSVTPLSNEASIYSVAKKHTHELHKKSLLKNLAQSIADSSDDGPLAIPTAVGFCMYIPWKARSIVGVFNEAFGRGYGEENDWCMRATKAGFKHYLDNSTFVFHEGGVSMSLSGDIPSRDIRSIPSHEDLLQDLHPDYRFIVESFLQRDTTLSALRQRIDALATELLCTSTLVIAHVLHNDPCNTVIGGTEKHVKDLVLSMTDNDNYVLFPAKKEGHLTISRVIDNTLQDISTISVGNCKTIAPSQDLQEFKTFLIDNNVSVVHIHQLIGSNVSLIHTAKECGSSVVYTIHDYYAMGSPQLLSSVGDFVDIPFKDETCPSDPLKSYGQWRNDVRPLLQEVDVFVAPSGTAKDIFARVFPFVEMKCIVQEHGTVAESQHIHVKNHNRKRICFLGNIHAGHKGRDLISCVVPLLINEGIDVYLVGTPESQWPEFIGKPHVHFFDRYTQSELPSLLYCISPWLVCLFSSWPETYSYTLSECWRMRIPVCTTNRGAFAERITQHGGGVIIEEHDPLQITDALVHKIDEKMHQKLCAQIDVIPMPDIDTVSEWYQKLYDSFPKKELFPSLPTLPNFLIIGAQKCGSTWLWKMLSEHPDIYLPQQSECEFFSKNLSCISDHIDEYSNTYFADHRQEQCIGEKTASYFWASAAHAEWTIPSHISKPNTPKNVYDTLGGDTKIILSLRHPVMRALSAYCHHLHHGSITHIGDFLSTAKQHGIIHMGFYDSHLREWLRWFPQENIHIVILEEDIVKNPRDTLHSIHTFLGANPTSTPEDAPPVFTGIKREHQEGVIYAHMREDSATGKRIIPIVTEKELEELYSVYVPGIQDLANIIQRPLHEIWNRDAFIKHTTPQGKRLPETPLAVNSLQEAPAVVLHHNTNNQTTPLMEPDREPIKEVIPKRPFLERSAYTTFSCLKDLWTDFGKPFPRLAHNIRHTVLAKRWPVTREAHEKPDTSYTPTFVLSEKDSLTSKQVVTHMRFQPSIHVLLHIHEMDEIQIRQCLNSITEQTYKEWKVTISDSSQSSEVVKDIIAQYNTRFPHRFSHTTEHRKNTVHHITEMYAFFIRIEDSLLPHAFEKMITRALSEAELPDLIYSDHDESTCRNASGFLPMHKPQWSPELLLSYNYIKSSFLIKKEVLASVITDASFRSDAFLYDILLRLTDGTFHVVHIPQILCHYYGDSLRNHYMEEESKRVLTSSLKRRGLSCGVIRPKASVLSGKLFFQVFHSLPTNICPKVTIIIPTKDRIDLLRPCIESIKAKTEYPNYDIVIINNNSVEKETATYLDAISERVITINTPEFNFAHINNEAVTQTSGEYVLLMNNDTEPADPLWLTTLVGTMLLDSRIGVVGSRLLYPPVHNVYRVQSIGMVIGRNWASLVQVNTKEELGYQQYNYAMRNCSAIGGACLLTRRDLFTNIGGLDENKFGVDFGDVDYCLRAQQEGYRVVCNPLSSVIHHESATRGNNGGLGAHLKRNEIVAFENKWGHMFGHDPYYNPHFSLSISHQAFTVSRSLPS